MLVMFSSTLCNTYRVCIRLVLRTKPVDEEHAYSTTSLALPYHTIPLAVRGNSLTEGRKPSFVTGYMSAATKLMLDVANN